ncbi:MAG: hypothetical protein OHK0026_04170 [Rhodocyclaceae bacterium]
MNRTHVLRVAALAAAVFVIGCASLLPSKEITLTGARLEELIAKHYAGTRSFLAIFDLQLANPKVSFVPEQNRVRAAMDVKLSNPLVGTPLQGSTVISGRLAYDAASRAIVLREPRAEAVDIRGVPERYAAPVSRIGTWLTDQVLKEFPLYTLGEQDLKSAGVQYAPKDLRVERDRLTLTLVPAAAR